MVNLIIYVYSFFLMFILFRYVLNRNHVLIILISLEFINLILFFFYYLKRFIFFREIYFLIIILSFFVCEGVVGLSLLVGIIRSHRRDFLRRLVFLKC